MVGRWSLICIATLLIASVYTLLALIYFTTRVRILGFGYLSVHGLSWSSESERFTLRLRSLALRPHRSNLLSGSLCTVQLLGLELDLGPGQPNEQYDKDTSGLANRIAGVLLWLTRIGLLRYFDLECRDCSLSIAGKKLVQLGSLTVLLSELPNDAKFQTASVKTPIIGTLKVARLKRISLNVKLSKFQLISKSAGLIVDLARTVNLTSGASLDAQHTLSNVNLDLKFDSIFLPFENISQILYNSLILEHIIKLRILYAADGEQKVFKSPLFEILDDLKISIGDLKYLKSFSIADKQNISCILGIKDIAFLSRKLANTEVAHSMLFKPDVLAHQSLITIVGMTINLDGRNEGHTSEAHTIFELPLMTITAKSSAMASLLQPSYVSQDPTIRRTQLNVVLTTPYVELIEYLQLVILAFRIRPKSSVSKGKALKVKEYIKLLSTINLTFYVHEPALRVFVPTEDVSKPEGEFFWIENYQTAGSTVISTMSSVLIELSSSIVNLERDHNLGFNLKLGSERIFLCDATGNEMQILRSHGASLKATTPSMIKPYVCFRAFVDCIVLEIGSSEAVDCLTRLFMSSVMISQVDQPQHCKNSSKSSDFMPAWVAEIEFETRNIEIILAGTDKEVSPIVRGLAAILQSCNLAYRPSSLVKRVVDNDSLVEQSMTDGMRDIILSILGRRNMDCDNKGLTFTTRGINILAIEGENTLKCRETILGVHTLCITYLPCVDKHGLLHYYAVHIPDMVFRYSLLKHYVTLLSFKIGRKILQSRLVQWFSSLHSKSPEINQAMEVFDIRVDLVRCHLLLPVDLLLLGECSSFTLFKERTSGPVLQTNYTRLFVESPTIKKAWDRFISIKGFRLELNTKLKNVGSKVWVFQPDAIAFRIPDQFVLYEVIESFKNMWKSAKQLHQRMYYKPDIYILAPTATNPKVLATIQIKTRAFFFEMIDDAFEARLNQNYRMGYMEQMARSTRQAAFDKKIAALKVEESRKDSREQSEKGTSEHNLPRRKVNTTDFAESKNLDSFEEETNLKLSPKKLITGVSPELAARINEAYDRLLMHNSSAWIRRVKVTIRTQRKKLKNTREIEWGIDEISDDLAAKERIVPISAVPNLFSTLLYNLDLLITKPSFHLENLKQFLFETGRGQPLDTEYTICCPMSLNIQLGASRVHLRDYPLPLVSVPPMHTSNMAPSWRVSADLVFAEALPGIESIWYDRTEIIPENFGPKGSPAYTIHVARSALSLKLYGKFQIDIFTALPTKLAWGASLQPALNYVIRAMDNFSKPQPDLSPKMGFWDKMRLVMHTIFRIRWHDDGDIHFTIKGSRDPYQTIGDGAGFIFCWRGNVAWDINTSGDSKYLSSVDSYEFIWAVPDFSRELAYQKSYHELNKEVLCSGKVRNSIFQKIIMKLRGRVRWNVGLVFERMCFPDDCRTCGGLQKCRLFNFTPHYEVVQKTRQHNTVADGTFLDSFMGFRSNWLHGSVTVDSLGRENNNAETSYNTIHLSPQAFTHFFSWWYLFSSVMSLPLKDGPLFPTDENLQIKLGRHLATMKYQLKLAPLLLSHLYRHKENEDYEKSTTTFTGIKGRIDRFSLDLHQRKEEQYSFIKELNTKRRTLHMSINSAQVILEETDLRVIAVNNVDPSATELFEDFVKRSRFLKTQLSGKAATYAEDAWFDMDDLVEIGADLSCRTSPKVNILPLAFAPNFTYVRHAEVPEDHKSHLPDFADSVIGRFGDEDTHDCVINTLPSVHDTQYALLQHRYEFLQLLEHKMSPIWEERVRIMERILTQHAKTDKELLLIGSRNSYPDTSSGFDSQEYLNNYEDIATYKNRFIIHNIQLKWNNSVRNISLNYIHQVSRRRGFVYYMSQRAISYLCNIVKEQNVTRSARSSARKEVTLNETPQNDFTFFSPKGGISVKEAQKLVEQLLSDREHKFYVGDESSTPMSLSNEPYDEFGMIRNDLMTNEKKLPQGLSTRSEYIVRLVAPQIQLQSETNDDAVVIISAEKMQLKIHAIMDETADDDDVEGLIQTKFNVLMSNAQFFVAHSSKLDNVICGTLKTYGATNGCNWPPWIPLELVYDFESDVSPFSRTVERCSATLSYYKYNQLRIKVGISTYSTQSNELFEQYQPVDNMVISFPRVIVTADSMQYNSLYLIITDLLLYSEPMRKQQNVQLESIILTSDFSDLSGAPESVFQLQGRIRQMLDINAHNKLTVGEDITEQCFEALLNVENELLRLENQLFFLMTAITAAQRLHEDRSDDVSPTMKWTLYAVEIIWHMVSDDNQPLADVGLSKASYRRIDCKDYSNHNTVEIEMMQAFNLLPKAVFLEVLSPYFSESRTVIDAQRSKMVRVHWDMLESIGGISIVDHFEINLFPLRIQIEHGFGRQIIQYIFPERNFLISSSHSFSNEKVSRERLRYSSDFADSSDSESTTSGLSQNYSNLSLRQSSKLFGRKSPSISSLRGSKKVSIDRSSLRSRLSIPLIQSTRHQRLNNNPDDDLQQILSRASSVVSLVYVKIPSVVLDFSYKGQKEKNFEDLDHFVFTMPTIEYTNKTWSYKDLAMHLKKEVFRAFLTHSGQIIREKLRHSKPRPSQPAVRQLTHYQSYIDITSLYDNSNDGENPFDDKPSGSIRIADTTKRLGMIGRKLDKSGYQKSNVGDYKETSGIFSNVITKHIHGLANLARHRNGIADETEESLKRKSRLLLGKFVGGTSSNHDA